jgi:hypothetical protein
MDNHGSRPDLDDNLAARGVLTSCVNRIIGGRRLQPFSLLLKSDGGRLVVRCVSPVGRVEPESTMVAVEESARTRHVRIVCFRQACATRVVLPSRDSRSISRNAACASKEGNPSHLRRHSQTHG